MGGCADFGGGRRACPLVRAADRAAGVRARQLRWVVGELHRWRPEERDCAALLSGDLEEYLRQAGSGKLRSRTVRGSGESTWASQRVRRSCLSRLLLSVGAPRSLPGAVPGVEGGVAGAAQVRQFLAWLARHPAPAGVRGAALAGLAVAGLRVGEAARLRTGQVGAAVLLGVERTPPGPGSSWVEDVGLGAAAERALARWLTVREHLVASDRVEHVFVGLAGSRSRNGPLGAGWPVSERSLDRAHRELVGEFLAVHNPRAVEPLALADLTLGRIAAAVAR